MIANARPLGDFKWRLYNIKKDPGETNDLALSNPQLFADLIKDYVDYTEKMGVLELGTEYEAQLELQEKMKLILLNAIRPWVIGFIILFIGFFIWQRRKRTSYSKKT